MIFYWKNTENINCTEWSATLHISKLQCYEGNILDSLYVESEWLKSTITIILLQEVFDNQTYKHITVMS